MTLNVRTTRQAMEQLYLSRNEVGDITFIVETERIRAHRWVMASVSPKYKAQFYGLRPDEGEIHVPNVLAAEFNVFLQLFYKDTINLTLDNIEAVIDLAKQSLVDEFVETCVRFIKEKIIRTNVCEAYRLAILYDLKALRIHCEEKIAAITKIVFVSDGFLQCNQDMLLNILKLDYFNCNEADVFNACIAWAREVCKRHHVNENDTKNLREALGNAIYQIRFASMKVEQFVVLHNSLDGFFTHDESMEIIYIIGRLKDFKSQLFANNRRNRYTSPRIYPIQQNNWKSGGSKRSRCEAIEAITISDDD